MRKGMLILSSAALISLTAGCGGGDQNVDKLETKVDSLEQRIQFVTDSIVNNWQEKLDSAVQATKQEMRAAMSSSGSKKSSGNGKKNKKTEVSKKGDQEGKPEVKKRGDPDKKPEVSERGGDKDEKPDVSER